MLKRKYNNPTACKSRSVLRHHFDVTFTPAEEKRANDIIQNEMNKLLKPEYKGTWEAFKI